MRSSNINYLAQVDHIRAIAALWIVFYHGEQLFRAFLQTGTMFTEAMWLSTGNPLFSLIVEGHTAVALFMVLSGFIFTYGAHQKHVDYKGFIINRLLRIYPLYVVIILTGLAVRPDSYSLPRLISTILPLANLQSIPALTFLAMSWAVAVEFQFYLLFPFIILYVNRSATKTILGIIAVAILFRLMGLAFWGNARDLSYWHLLGRIDQFVLGMGTAVALRSARFGERSLRGLLIASVPMAIATIFLFHRLGGWPSTAPWKILWPTAEGMIWSLFILGYVGIPQFLPGVADRALRWIGEMSFSIYLLHFPVIDVVRYRLHRFPRWTGGDSTDALITTALVVIPLLLFLSCFTYTVIEKPFLNLRVPYLKPISESPLSKRNAARTPPSS